MNPLGTSSDLLIAAVSGRTLSMHTDGDPGSQIALTRITYGLEPVKLTIARESDNVILTWPTGTLQQSDNATGSYSDIGTATSPYTNSITGTQKFYRIRVQ